MDRPRTLNGLKNIAKRLKRETGCAHTAALENVARDLGFQNYRHAFKHYEGETI